LLTHYKTENKIRQKLENEGGERERLAKIDRQTDKIPVFILRVKMLVVHLQHFK
jgi:ribosomal protein L39E